MDRGLSRIDPRQPVEAHFHTLSDFLREIYDNSLVHPELAPPWDCRRLQKVPTGQPAV